ncbi:MAG: thiamine pyrophosphate-binding protein [Caulobacteraceae bacterium]|nr:thiamine pyrophosphate-binding protein [Caulobacteraceae bacterium]
MAVMTGAQMLVRVLLAHGVTHVFCVPGESYLAVLDALADVKDEITVISCRHEAGAANMAVAHGKLTGRPGICMVTRGPGATHASVGVHTARQDSVPMILFVGQVARGQKGREAFQEVDYAAAFGPLAKWAVEIDAAGRVAELVGRAFSTAVQGRAGPVVIALPEDMLREEAPAAPIAPSARAVAAPSPPFVAALAGRLRAAERPLMILGGTGWTATALEALAAWAAEAGLPIALSFRRKDLLDNDHPCYAGDLGLGPNPRLIERVRACDLVIALGARLGENPTQGYGLFTPDRTAEALVHIHSGAQELGRVWPASLAAVADVSETATALCSIPLPKARWEDWRAAARREAIAFGEPVSVEGRVNLSEVFDHLNSALPPDAIVCNGAGNYAAWLHRFYRHRRFGTQLAPTSGAMGFGVPAAIAAKITAPGREVVAVAGDGCFLMSGQELATAVQYQAGVIFLVVDNGSYGTIRMHQERDYPGRVMATDLINPDFVAYARAFGAWATRVEDTGQFPAALRDARVAGGPALIHLKTDIQDIAPGRTLRSLAGA